MKSAVLALTLLLNVASQAAAVPEEPSNIQRRFTGLKTFVAELKDNLDRTIAVSPDAQHLQIPFALSDALGFLLAQMQTNEEAVVASLSAGQEIFLQMIKAEELSGEWHAAIANLNAVFKAHLAEYNVLLKPIIDDFKLKSLQFRDVAAPKVANLRNEFDINARETINAFQPVLRTLLKMGSNLRDSINLYVEEYRGNIEGVMSVYENLSEEEKLRRRQEMEVVANDIVAKIQRIYEIGSAPAPSS